MKFKLTDEYIQLIQLLKTLGLVGTGGEAKIMVEQGEVKLNGEVEFRKRAKLRKGDKVEYNGDTITIE